MFVQLFAPLLRCEIVLTKDFNGLTGNKDSKNGLDRVSEGSIGLELVADRCGQQILDLEL